MLWTAMVYRIMKPSVQHFLLLADFHSGLPGWWNRMWRPKDILLSGNPDTMINFQKQVKKLWNFKVDPCRMRKRISWKKISFSGKLSRCVAGMNQQNGNTCQRPP